MKFSEFKIKKRMIFKNNEVTVEKNTDEKIVNFVDLDIQLLHKMYSEVLSKLPSDVTDNRMLYTVLPYLTDIELDVDYDEFERMMSVPSKELCQLCEAIIDEMNLLIETSKQISQINKKIKDVNKKASKITPNKRV